VQVFTKSTAALRDLPLFREGAARGLVAVSVSLASADPRVAKVFEPQAAGPHERLKLLAELRKNNVFAGVLLAPVIPYVTDTRRSFEEAFARIRDAGGEYVLPSILTLGEPQVRERMFKLLRSEFPLAAPHIESLYGGGALPEPGYVQRISGELAEISRTELEFMERVMGIEPTYAGG
jgi:DNA repair photolyase